MDFTAKPIGTSIDRERALGTLEMSKVIRSARAPISGVIVAINDKVKSAPDLTNTDPYGEGWLVRMRPTAWLEETGALVTGPALPPAIQAYMSELAITFGEAGL